MTSTGIDGLGVYIPSLTVSLDELAKERGVDPEKFRKGLGQHSFAVPKSNEDTVTLAAEALDDLLNTTRLETKDIGRLVIATETQVDAAKNAGNYLADLFDLPGDCETYEVKHTCIAGTYAIFDAMNWIGSGENHGKKAVIICSDIAQYPVGGPAEPTQGAGAVAVLVADNPSLLSIDKVSGVASGNARDFWRPTYMDEAQVDGKTSVEVYLQALEDSVTNLITRGGELDFNYSLFHTPYAKMSVKAFDRLGDLYRSAKGKFQEMVEPSLDLIRRSGNMYTASLFLCLADILQKDRGVPLGSRMSLFGFGSGYSGRFYQGTVEGHLNFKNVHTPELLAIEDYERLRSGALTLEKEQGIILDAVDEMGFRSYRRL